MADPLRLRQPGPPETLDTAAPRIDDARLGDVIGTEARLQRLYGHAIWSEGPVWWAAEETLVFSDVRGRRVLGWRTDGAVDVLIDATQYCNGNAIDTEGRMLHCEHGRRGISRTEPGGETRMVVERAEDGRLNSPNDILRAGDGAIWFTDPTFGTFQPEEGFVWEPEIDHTSVYRWDGKRLARMADPHQPNGLAFSPDESVLYVSETPQDGAPVRILAYDWDGAALGAPRVFAEVEAGIPDGFAVDARGWVWSSSGAGVQVFDAEGATLGLIPAPHTISNCAFSPDGRRLFCTGGPDLLVLELNAP